jgi:hypothetical protein
MRRHRNDDVGELRQRRRRFRVPGRVPGARRPADPDRLGRWQHPASHEGFDERHALDSPRRLAGGNARRAPQGASGGNTRSIQRRPMGGGTRQAWKGPTGGNTWRSPEGPGGRQRSTGSNRWHGASFLRRSGIVDEVAEPRKGWQARGSQANLFASKTLWGSRRSSVRAVGEARERIGLWDGLWRRGGIP